MLVRSLRGAWHASYSVMQVSGPCIDIAQHGACAWCLLLPMLISPLLLLLVPQVAPAAAAAHPPAARPGWPRHRCRL